MVKKLSREAPSDWSEEFLDNFREENMDDEISYITIGSDEYHMHGDWYGEWLISIDDSSRFDPKCEMCREYIKRRGIKE